MQGCKLRSGVNWPGSLKQNGIKKGLVYCSYSFVTSANLQEDLRSRSSNCQGLDLKVVKAHWSKSWSDSLVPKETMCIVIWSSLFFRFQKERIFSVQLPADGEKCSSKQSSCNAFLEWARGKHYHSFQRKPSGLSGLHKISVWWMVAPNSNMNHVVWTVEWKVSSHFSDV